MNYGQISSIVALQKLFNEINLMFHFFFFFIIHFHVSIAIFQHKFSAILASQKITYVSSTLTFFKNILY